MSKCMYFVQYIDSLLQHEGLANKLGRPAEKEWVLRKILFITAINVEEGVVLYHQKARFRARIERKEDELPKGQKAVKTMEMRC